MIVHKTFLHRKMIKNKKCGLIYYLQKKNNLTKIFDNNLRITDGTQRKWEKLTLIYYSDK